MWNAQSLNNKIIDFIQTLEDNSIDLGLVSESWLQSQNNTVTAVIKEAGYNIYHSNRTVQRGGGVAILSKSIFKPKFEKSFNYLSFECVIQSLKVANHAGNLTIIVIYRHKGDTFSTFLEEFYEFVEYVKLNFMHFIICGDFNVHVNKSNDPNTIKFIDVLNTFSLLQYVTSSTHRCGNTLDLIITDQDGISINDVVVDSINRLGSDHSIIYFNVLCNIESSTKKEITFRDFKKVNMSSFQNDISSGTNKYLTEADGTNFKSCVNLYCDIFSDTVNKHAPIVTKLVHTVTRPPWMDSEYVDLRKQRRILYKKWKKDKTPENRANFEKLRSDARVQANEKRCNYYQDSIKSSGGSQKELFRVFNSLIDGNKKSQLPFCEDTKVLASKFNNYFIQKIENIRHNLDTPVVNINSVGNNAVNSMFNSFKVVTMEDLQKQIKCGKIKTSQTDPLPAYLLRSSIEQLAPSMLHLVNTSLATGSMEGMKDSIIVPILKKDGLDLDELSNYRPVCGGLYVDKLIQKSVLVQLNDYMTFYDLHIPYQSGYKSNHSCETVLLSILDSILLHLDEGSCCLVLLLDLSAAFDTVDLDKLISILSDDLGLGGTVLEWFKSFLYGRKQATSVNGCRSEFKDVKYGVPQGSVLGPVLFNIYIRKFIQLLRDAGFTVHGYADDHQVISSFRISFQYHALGYSLPRCMNIISQFMSSYFLKLNAGKSKLLIFSPQNIQDNICFDSVYLGSNLFLPVSFEAMNLGVKLDSQLSFSSHISMLLAQSYKHVSNIGRIRRYLTKDEIRTLVYALVMCRIDNCNSLLYGISELELSRLQKLQNSCARIIYGRRKFEHVTDIFNELHWLPVKRRIIFKALMFVFKVFLNVAPIYLSNCLEISDVENRILHVPKTLTSYGDRAFRNFAPRLWNALPVFLRNSNSISFFSSQLKHHLFSNFSEFKSKVNMYNSILT